MIEELLEMLREGCYLTDLRKELNCNDGSIANVLAFVESSEHIIRRTAGDKGVKFKLVGSHQNRDVHNYKFQGSKLRVLFISDTHLGSIGDRVDILNNLFEYAVVKGIKLIIHTGDFIEGVKYKEHNGLKYTNIDEMTNYAIKNYPREKSIATYVLYGNHDEWSKTTLDYNVDKVIHEHRPDIISVGYSRGCIKLNRDFIFLQHPTSSYRHEKATEDILNYYDSIKPTLIAKGHTHTSLITEDPLVMYVPCLYDSYKERLKGAWEVEMHFDKGEITDLELVPLLVEPKIEPVTNINIKTLKNS